MYAESGAYYRVSFPILSTNLRNAGLMGNGLSCTEIRIRNPLSLSHTNTTSFHRGCNPVFLGRPSSEFAVLLTFPLGRRSLSFATAFPVRRPECPGVLPLHPVQGWWYGLLVLQDQQSRHKNQILLLFLVDGRKRRPEVTCRVLPGNMGRYICDADLKSFAYQHVKDIRHAVENRTKPLEHIWRKTDQRGTVFLEIAEGYHFPRRPGDVRHHFPQTFVAQVTMQQVAE